MLDKPDGFLLGIPHFQRYFAVPDAAMVGAMVTNDGEMMCKGHQNLFIQTIVVGYSLPILGVLEILQPARDVSQKMPGFFTVANT